MAQRYRWIMLSVISFVIAVSAIIGIVYWVNSGDSRVEGRGDAVEAWLFPLRNLMLILGVIGVIILIIKYSVKSRVREAQYPQPSSPQVAPNPSGFPVITRIPEYSPPTDGPGRYRIKGVNQSTKQDATLDLEADSAANAKVKAELNGVIVTSVTKTA